MSDLPLDAIFLVRDTSGRGYKTKLPLAALLKLWPDSVSDSGIELPEWAEDAQISDQYRDSDNAVLIVRIN